MLEVEPFPHSEKLPPELLQQLSDDAIRRFSGDGRILESAIGCLQLGRFYGWRVMLLLHAQPTVKKYEDILGVDLRDVLPEFSSKTHKSMGFRVYWHSKRFWDSVLGLVPGARNRLFEA